MDLLPDYFSVVHGELFLLIRETLVEEGKGEQVMVVRMCRFRLHHNYHTLGASTH